MVRDKLFWEAKRQFLKFEILIFHPILMVFCKRFSFKIFDGPVKWLQFRIFGRYIYFFIFPRIAMLMFIFVGYGWVKPGDHKRQAIPVHYKTPAMLHISSLLIKERHVKIWHLTFSWPRLLSFAKDIDNLINRYVYISFHIIYASEAGTAYPLF